MKQGNAENSGNSNSDDEFLDFDDDSYFLALRMSKEFITKH